MQTYDACTKLVAFITHRKQLNFFSTPVFGQRLHANGTYNPIGKIYSVVVINNLGIINENTVITSPQLFFTAINAISI